MYFTPRFFLTIFSWKPTPPCLRLSLPPPPLPSLQRAMMADAWFSSGPLLVDDGDVLTDITDLTDATLDHLWDNDLSPYHDTEVSLVPLPKTIKRDSVSSSPAKPIHLAVSTYPFSSSQSHPGVSRGNGGGVLLPDAGHVPLPTSQGLHHVPMTSQSHVDNTSRWSHIKSPTSEASIVPWVSNPHPYLLTNPDTTALYINNPHPNSTPYRAHTCPHGRVIHRSRRGSQRPRPSDPLRSARNVQTTATRTKTKRTI